MNIIKIKKYEVRDVHEFIPYGTYRKSREESKQYVQKTCFRCHHKFQDNDKTWLAVIQGYQNELFCKDCASDFFKEKDSGN